MEYFLFPTLVTNLLYEKVLLVFCSVSVFLQPLKFFDSRKMS